MPLRGADPSLWYNMPGVVAAYQPLGAPDSLTARRSIARGGDSRYAASSGALPDWHRGIGWTYDGVAQYLDTGVLHTDAGQLWSMLIFFSAYSSNGNYLLASDNNLVTGGLGLCPNRFGAIRFLNNGQLAISSASMSSGVMGLAGVYGYKDGIRQTGTIGTSGQVDRTIYLGAGNSGAGAAAYSASQMHAVLIADRPLQNDEVWLASQQMRYCNIINAHANAWSRLRQWFFITPPAPAVATPVLSTIYINSADIGDTSLFDDVSGAAVSSTYARTGSKSFKLNGTDYLQADLTSSATKYSKFGLLITATPASDALLCAWQETGTEHVSLYLTDKRTLQMRQGSTIIQASPTTLEEDTWYCIEAKIVVHTTTGRFQVRIDGVDDMAAIGINTDDDVDGVINEVRFEAPVDDTYIDDIVVREDQWCGVGGVYVIVPTAAGTVEEWTGAYTDVDDLPPSFTDYITATAESGVDQVFRHGELAGDYDIGIVGVFAKGRLDSAAVDTVFRALARTDTTDHQGDAQVLDTIGVYARVLMTTNPDGSVAWTTHAANNALQIGART